MEPLPMPLRLAAGLVATALEEVQALPKKLIELPVTAVSQVLQVSMRMQQKVTELAIKGDQALGGLREVPETPEWARFDEDEEAGPFGGNDFSGLNFGGANNSLGGNGLASAGQDDEWDAPLPATRTVSPIKVTREPEPGGPTGLEDYADWTLPQLRGRFRSMSLEQVQALLDWETSHQDRPPYVTMLSNRAASITGR